MKKINVVGTSGSGKSSFSRKLARKLNTKYIEMDLLFWKENWQQPSNDEFFPKISAAIDDETWVLDGNYSRSQNIKWQNVDTIIWLDYGFWRTFIQIVNRSIKRAWHKNELWEGTGNKESFFKTFCHKDSIILWMLTNYHRNKLKYKAIMQSPSLKHVRFIRLRNPKQAQALITSLTQTEQNNETTRSY